MRKLASVCALFALMPVLGLGQLATTLHPQAEAFRTQHQAFTVGPPIPADQFEYVVSTEYEPRGCDWILVEHRSRSDEDGATWQDNSPIPPTKLSFFNPRTRQLRPFPAELHSKSQSWALRSGRGNVVVVESRSRTQDEIQPARAYAIQCLDGRTLELPNHSQYHVIDSEKFIIHSEGKVHILHWGGESREVALDRPAKYVNPTIDPAIFVISDGSYDRGRGELRLDTRTGTTTQIERLAYDIAVAAIRSDIQLVYAFRDNYEEQAELSITGYQDHNAPLMLEAKRFVPLPSGVLPHQYPTRVRLTGDFRTHVRLPDRLFQNAWPGSFGLLFTHDADRHFVWYLRDNQMMLREITPLPLADYEEYVRLKFRERALSYVEMVGKWASYAMSYDSNASKLSFQDLVTTYITDKRLLDQFVFFGDPADSKDNPSEILGYLDTPYGRATVAWDGSARWVPKAAP